MHGPNSREEGEGMPSKVLRAEMRDVHHTDVRSDVTPTLPGEVGEEESVG
jgi:hypothetical protein